MNDFSISHIFTLLFLMLGPFKIIGPYAEIIRTADRKLAHKIAFRATIYSGVSLLIAAFLGETILKKYGIPVPILALSAGIILFLVAIMKIIQQFEVHKPKDENASIPSLEMALYPLAFPTIVTPYGIAAVVVLLSMAPDAKIQFQIGAVVLGIMLLNLAVMLLSRKIPKFIGLILALLGAILGMVQVALGLLIIYNSMTALLGS